MPKSYANLRRSMGLPKPWRTGSASERAHLESQPIESDLCPLPASRGLGQVPRRVAAHAQRGQMLVHEQFHRSLRRSLRLAFLLYAGHALPSILPLPLPLGFVMGTATMGFCWMPLASAPLYAFFAFLSE